MKIFQYIRTCYIRDPGKFLWSFTGYGEDVLSGSEKLYNLLNKEILKIR